MKIVSAHQPAFLPWLGLVHKLMVSDVFIFMDIAKFRKRAFMHRNYIEINDTKKFIGLKVNKDSDYKTCDEVKISEFHSNNIKEIKEMITLNYKNYKYYDDLNFFLSENLVDELIDLNSICLKQLNFIKDQFKIEANIVKESEIIDKNKRLNASERLLEHALKTGANIYVTGVNSVDYLEKEYFKKKKIFNYVQEFDYSPFYNFQSSNEPLSIIHQIAKIGFEGIKNLMIETQIKKKDIIKIYD